MALTRAYSEQAEKAILGTMLGDPLKVSHCVSVLNEEDFYNEGYKKIFNVIKSLFDERNVIDITSVTNRLNDLGYLEEIGGVKGLVDLTECVSVENVTFYIDILKDKTNLRKLATFLDETSKNFNIESNINIHQYLDNLEKEFLKITRFRSVSDFTDSQHLVDRYNDILKNKDAVIPYIDSGYAYLNKKLNGGWKNGSLNILAARTGVGKTAIALNFAINAAKNKNPVAFFSGEMSGDELMCRMISIVSSIDADKTQTFNYRTEEDLMRLQHALKVIPTYPIYIDDTANISLVDLVAKARKLKSECPNLSLIIVDYLQLVTAEVGRQEGKQREVAKVATELKALARDLNVPIIALAQLSRAADKVDTFGKKDTRTQKKPQLSDLKESGQIEQDADLVLFLYKENYYEQDNQPINEEVQLLIGKNRNGEKGTIYLVSTPRYFQYKEKLKQEEDKPDIGE